MTYESPTEFVRKRPLLGAILDRVEKVLIASIIGLGIHLWDLHHEQNDVKWIGQHLSEKVNK